MVLKNVKYDQKPTWIQVFGVADWICAPPLRLFSEGKVIYVSSKTLGKRGETATRWLG